MGFIEWFLRSNSMWARLLRTVVQGLLGVLVAELPELIGLLNIPAYLQAIIVAVIMAILSPIMAELGKYVEAAMAAKRQAAVMHMMTKQEEQEEIAARDYTKK